MITARIKASDFDTTHIDIIGRGPSMLNYIARDKAFVICCHYPTVDNCNAIASNHFGDYGYYTLPYITRQGIDILSDRKNTVKTYAMDKHIIVDDWCVYTSHLLNRCNTGVTAYTWAQAQKPKSTHLWGFDSIWSDAESIDAYRHPQVTQDYAHDNFNSRKDEEHFKDQKRNIINVRNSKRYWKKLLQPNTIVHK
jgi:hypothetical protein